MAAEKIRDSVIAGSWYPGEPSTLRREITRYLADAPTQDLGGSLVALIAPHAGYMYSGSVAAHAYKLLQQQSFDCVLVLAPSHRAHFQGASVYDQGGFRTPLGVVSIRRDLVDGLLRHKGLRGYLPQAHDQEHSLEIQLPFLQCVLGPFHLVPVVMGDHSHAFCEELAEAIAEECAGKNVLLVASSDLSHYHPYLEAKKLDQIVLDRIAAFDSEGLSRELNKGTCEACGAGPMVTVMLASRKLGANKSRVLHYANSGDVTGDKSGVVGYVAAAFYANPGIKAGRLHTAQGKVGVDLGLSDEEKKTLHEIASEAIRSRLLKEPAPERTIQSEKLKEHRGAFVCLHLDGELRGCIGMIEPRCPLHETVREMGLQAAFCDPRFSPLGPEEFDRIHLEISVLTPMERIHQPTDVHIGKHGVMIRKGLRSGLLLPQVATEHQWDAMQFLQWTCRKAGLPSDAWRDADTEIFAFSADVF